MPNILFIVTVVISVGIVITIPFIWTNEISLEDQHIPTIINGVTTCTALIIGFSTASLTLGISNRILVFTKDIAWIVGILAMVMFSAIILAGAYSSMVWLNDFHEGFRNAMTSLSLSLTTLLLTFSLLINALDRMHLLD